MNPVVAYLLSAYLILSGLLSLVLAIAWTNKTRIDIFIKVCFIILTFLDGLIIALGFIGAIK